MPSIAMTDHGVMYGIVEFYKACRDAGIKPVLGCETYINPKDSHHARVPHSPFHHLVLLAESDEGFRNLSKLISLSHLEGFYYKPRIDKELLAQYSKGLIGLSACLHGEVTHHLADGNLEQAEASACDYRDIFGKENFFLEMQDHGIAEQRKANLLIPELVRRTGLRPVATNDIHYLMREHAEAHEVLLALQTQTVMSDPKRMRYSSNEFYLKSRAEMARLFPDFPEALNVTTEIADRCNVEIKFGELHFPSFDLPEPYAGQGMTEKEYLVEVAGTELQKLYDIPDFRNPTTSREREIMDRFHHELEIIDRTGFVNYFLVVRDFVEFAHTHGIPVGPGRGSGGGSIVAYACGIIAIDPLRYNLIFERFLNPDRVSPPDFDIDFCQARRGEVIDYVKQKYGADHVAQIITFGSLGAKTVLRDVGRALEIPFSKTDELSKKIPEDPKMTLAKALVESPDFAAAAQNDEALKQILPYALVLEGLYRNPGVHAAGVVIGEKPLIDILPLGRDKEGQPVTQFAKEPVEEIGLLKMDFLGLKTLTVLQESVDLVARFRDGQKVDLKTISMEDAKTYALLSRAETIGVFQVESSGMRDLIRQIGINNIEDLIAVIALYRPGPMNMLPDYIARKTGAAQVEYAHPKLEPILKDTYGVMVYQEQVQKAANVLAGYSLGEADILRRAMGKKKAEVMVQQRATFVAGCQKTSDIPRKVAEEIFDSIAKFAEYGFNKAHSAGYGIVSYQTAYMKANFPAEFMSGLISSEIGNFDKLPGFITEANDMGLQVLAPDVNHSGVRFEPEGMGIRYGLAGIKGVGSGASEAIIREREDSGPFTGLVDFCARVDSSAVNRKCLESLVRAGAMDSFGQDRGRLFNGIDFAMSRSQERIRDRQSGQGSLFDLMATDDEGESAGDELPPAPPWSEKVALAGERELLGIYITGHPLNRYEALLARYQLTPIGAMRDAPDGKDTRVGGIVSKIRKMIDKRTKETWAVLTLEDRENSTEVLVFAESYRNFGDAIQQEAPVLVCGAISRREDTPKLVAVEIYALDDVPRHFATRVGIHLPLEEAKEPALQKLREILRLHPGTTPSLICLACPSGEKILIQASDAFAVLPDQNFMQTLESEFGPSSVRVSVNPAPYIRGRPESRRYRPRAN